MNNNRSFANSPRVVKEENPNRARIKKKTPTRVRSENGIDLKPAALTKPVLEATDRVGNVVVKQSTEH